jgi:hypothetical protein
MPRKKPAQPVHIFAANTAGVLGYFSLLMQLLWLTVIFLPALLQNQQFRSFFVPEATPEQPAPAVVAPLANSPLLMTGVGIVTVVMIVLTIYLLVKIPATVAKSGKKVTSEVTEAVIPIITHHKKVSPAKKRALTFKLSFIFKFSVVLLSYLLIFIPAPGIHALDSGIVWAIGTIFAASGAVWFGLQYGAAKVFHIPTQQLL